MKKLDSIILPVLLILILAIQLYGYSNGTINYAIIGIAFGLTPAAIFILFYARFKEARTRRRSESFSLLCLLALHGLYLNLLDNVYFKYLKWLMVVLIIISLILGALEHRHITI